MWDLGSTSLVKEFRAHTESILSVDFSPGGRRILSCGMDASLRLWDMNTKCVLFTNVL